MANILDILTRAQALRQETALNSITPDRAGGIMYDTLILINQMQLEGGSLLISKVYSSVAAMEADTTPTSDLTGRALRPGQLAVIVPSSSSSSDMGSVYRYNEPGSWTLCGKIGGLPMDTVPIQGSSNGITSGAVYQLQQEVTDLTTNVDKNFRDLIGNVIADKTVNVSGTNTTDTGVVLKAGEPYWIYVKCATATTHSNCGVWVRNASNSFTQIKTLTAEEYAQGAYIEYTPVEDVSLWVRPYSTGSVKVTVWDEKAPATITEIVESSITDAILSESFQYSNIVSGNDGVTSTNILWPDGATGVMAVTYTNGLPSRVTYSHILDGVTRNFEQVVTYADGDVVSNAINEI